MAAIKRQAKKIYRTPAREYNGDTGRFQTGDSGMYIHLYVSISANLYKYAWNSPLKYADPMGRDVEESEWERYLELGLTGYVKSGYHMIIDYMPDELMLVSGAYSGKITSQMFNSINGMDICVTGEGKTLLVELL